MTRKPTKKRVGRFDPEPSARFGKRVLQETRSPGALIGRLAVWVWLPDESTHGYTKDLDLAVGRETSPLIRSWIRTNGLQSRELSIGGVNVHYPKQNINVDFIDRSGVPYEDLSPLFRAAVEDAIAAENFAEIESVVLPVASPEFLIAMKLATGEDKDEQDVKSLLLGTEVDVDEVRGIVRRFLGVGSVGRFEVLLRAVNHPKARLLQRYRGQE